MHDAAPAFSFSGDVLAAFLRKVYRGFDTATGIEPAMWREVLRIVNSATVQGLAEAPAPPTHEEDVYTALRHSNEVFAAFKVHNMGRLMAQKLTGEDGRLKPFRQWADEVQDITSHHVGAWLRTEYDTAVIRAHNAADWRQFERDKDVMPNLRWMPTTSAAPESSHRTFWEKKLTLPVDHPFWDKHHPGDRWNCKCSLEQTDDPPTPELIDEFDDVKPQRGLENNPGRDGRTFSDNHPYFPASCAKCGFYRNASVKNRLLGFFSNRRKDCYNCPYIDAVLPNGFKEDEVFKERLLISNMADAQDLDSNLNVARSLLASFPDMKVKIRPHVLEKGVRNPELEINGLIADNKMINGEKGVSAAFKTAIKQGCQAVVIDLDARLKRLNVFQLSKYLSRRKADFEKGTMKECYVVFGQKAVKVQPYVMERTKIQDVLKKLEP